MRIGILTNQPLDSTRGDTCRDLLERGLISEGTLLEKTVSEEEMLATTFDETLHRFLKDVDLLFLNLPTAFSFNATAAAIKQGVHVFLDECALPAQADVQTLVRFHEEAGVEVGVSRPLRFHPTIRAWSESWRGSLVAIRRLEERGASLGSLLLQAIDLSCLFVGDGEVQKIDAQAARTGAGVIDFVAAGLRFRNGAYVQVQVGYTAGRPVHDIVVSGPGFYKSFALEELGMLRENRGTDSPHELAQKLAYQETKAFIMALLNGRPVPLSLAGVLNEQQIVENIRQKLR